MIGTLSRSSHRKRHQQYIKRRHKRLAAALLGAAVISSAMLPGMAAPTAHAAKPDINNEPAPVTQQVKNNAPQVNLQTGAPVNLPSGQAQQQTPAQNDKAPGSGQQQTQPSPGAAEHNKSAPTQQGDRQTTAPTDKSDGQASDQGGQKDSGAPAKFEKVLDITATAYAPGARDNDQWGEKTYLGTTVRPGVVAVDPNVIPIGSQLYIQYPDGHGEYARAEDTGGAIKGNRIDVALANDKQAENFGIKNVKVYVVSTPSQGDKGQQEQSGQRA